MEKLNIVIPVYNEEGSIGKTLAKIKEDVTVPNSILIIYDFPEDNTLPALEEAEKKLAISVRKIQNKYGHGVLNAIKTGLEEAGSEYVAVMMADFSDQPETLNEMIAKADSENADIVCASRYMKGGCQRGGPLVKGLLSRCAGLSLHYLAGVPTHDPTNSFKLYRKSFLEKTPIESTGGFELGLELVVKAHKQGYKICEIPSEWNDRMAGKSRFKLAKWLPRYLKWYFLAFT